MVGSWFLKWGYPNSWMAYFMDNLSKMDDNWAKTHGIFSETTSDLKSSFLGEIISPWK